MQSGLIARVRPEVNAGGFVRDNGGIAFFTRVNALLKPGMTVIDLGAGRGEMFDKDDCYESRLVRLQGKVKKVIGIDVDPAIAQHPFLDERHVIEADGKWPVPDGSVDMIVADWVLEHIEFPALFAREAGRVLAPGGWLCARTPNKWGYVGIATRAVPNALHRKFLKRLWPGRSEVDVFPTFYRLNSTGELKRHFPAEEWRHCSYAAASTPKYHGGSRILFAMVAAYQKLMPGPLQADLMVFVQKKPG